MIWLYYGNVLDVAASWMSFPCAESEMQTQLPLKLDFSAVALDVDLDDGNDGMARLGACKPSSICIRSHEDDASFIPRIARDAMLSANGYASPSP